MPEDIASVVKIIDREDQTFRAKRKFRSLLEDASDEAMAAMVWEAFREGGDVGKDLGYGGLLAEADAAAYEAQDVLAYIEATAEHYPGGVKEEGSAIYRAWGDDAIPGRVAGVATMIEARADDDSFIEGLRQGYGGLPSPWDQGLALELASQGHLAVEELPEGLLEELAGRHVRHGKGDHLPLSRKQPWSDEVWGEAIVAAAEDREVVFKNAKVLQDFVDYASVEKMVALAHRVKFGSDLWDGVDVLVSLGEPVLEPLKDALLGLEVEAPEGDVWPPVAIIPAYLALCGSLEVEPDSAVDSAVAAFVEVYKPMWSGSRLQEHHARLRDALSVMPQARLEPMLLEPESLSFYLAGACPTEAVVQRGVEALEDTSDLGWSGDDMVADLVRGFGAAAYDSLKEAIGEGRVDRREKVIEVVAASEEPAAAEILVAALQDSAKGIRQTAADALVEIGDDAALDALGDAIGGRRKATRLAAARVLTRLSASQRRFQMAQAQLERERTSDVKEVLSTIEEPVEDPSGVDREAIAEALDGGEDWRSFVDDVGADIVEIYSLQVDYWYDSNYAILKEMLDALGDDLKAFEGALAPMEEMSSYRAERHIEVLSAFPVPVGEVLAKRLSLGMHGELELKTGLQWLIDHAPRAGGELFVSSLTDRRKTVRQLAVEGVAINGDELASDVWELLLDSSTKADGREGAAWALEALACAEAVPHLESALKGERSGRVKEAIQSALAASQNAALSVEGFADDSAGNAGLDESLAAIGAQRPEALPDDLPALHWRTGAALSEGATNWCLRELLREDMKTHSETLVAVCHRLAEEDRHALCDALVEAAPRDDDGWGLYVQAILGADRHIEALGPKLEALASSASTNWASDGVEVFVRHGSDEAIQWLDHHW